MLGSFRVYSEHLEKASTMVYGPSCDMGFAFAFVIVLAIFRGEHNKVANGVGLFRCMMLIRMVSLSDFGGKEVVLCLLDIEGDTCDDVVGSDLFHGGIGR